MNTDTGRIISAEKMKELEKCYMNAVFTNDPNRPSSQLARAFEAGKIKPMKIPPTLMQRIRGKVGRNAACPCGSGKKFKKCCYTG